MNIGKTIRKIISGVGFYVALLILIILFLLQLHPVQASLAGYALDKIAEKTDYQISIDRLKISWLNSVELTDLLVVDHMDDTLLATPSLKISYRFRELIHKEFNKIEAITSPQVVFKLLKENDTAKLNINSFIDSFKTSETEKDTAAEKPLIFEQIVIGDLTLAMDNGIQSDKVGIDFNHMLWRITDLNISDFQIKKDTLMMDVNHFSGAELHSSFQVDRFIADFRLTKQSLSIVNLDLQTPTSRLSDSLAFYYTGFDDLFHFKDSVSFLLHLDKTYISQKDISFFIGSDKVKSDISVDGVLRGKISDLNIKDSRISIGKNTFIQGGLSCFGLPDLANTFILADLTDASLAPADLEPYFKVVADQLAKTFGKINFNGSFVGYPKDFVAKADFFTGKGEIKTDLNLKIPEDPNKMIYKGTLELIDLNLENLFENQYIDRINMIASVDGSGITIDNADLKMNAFAYNTTVNGYQYDTIHANGNFSEKYFDGTIEIIDPNLTVNGEAQLDFTSEVEILKVNVHLDTLNSEAFDLAPENLAVESRLNIDVFDLDLDNFNGLLNIDSTVLSYQGKRLVIDSVRLFATLTDNTRTLNFSLPGLTIEVSGEFKITDLIQDFPVLINDYKEKLLLKTDSTLTGSDANYKVSFHARVEDIDQYLKFFELPIKIGTNTFIEASLRQSKNSNISLFVESDAIVIGKATFTSPTLDLNASKGRNDKNILTDMLFEATTLRIPNVPEMEDIFLEAIWFKKNINMSTSAQQKATNSKVNISTNVSLEPDSVTIRMLPSDLVIIDQTWDFNPQNEVVIKADYLSIYELGLTEESGESITINGTSSGGRSEINFVTENLNINKVNLFTETQVEGSFSSRIEVEQESTDAPARFTGDFDLQKFYIKDVLVGDLTGNASYVPDEKKISSLLNVSRINFKTIAVSGDYYPYEEQEQLDFDIHFNQAALKMIAPFLEENVSNIKGYADGKFKVTGSAKSPEIKGESFVNGAMTINYLNTTYRMMGDIEVTKDRITLDGISLKDRKGAKAILKGFISHDGFTDIATDIAIYANNFEFLNTTKVDNSLYYGSAYGTGDITIVGTPTNLNIAANIKTENGTRFFIPVSESSDVEQEAYITFINFSDTAEQEEERSALGFNINFNLEVTEDAYCELIFDIRTGNIIKGRGNGNLDIRMNKDGEFNIFGPLEIFEGTYNFTMASLVNKQFEVIPESRITWYGDPYNAMLDLGASYMQRASLDQLDPIEDDQPQANTSNKVPFLAILSLDGEMIAPDIAFDIRFEDATSVSEDDKAKLSTVTKDEQELRRQFMSLLLFRKFSPRNSFIESGSRGGGSFSEFIANQMSYLLSQLDENLEVELDLASLDEDAFNNLQLRLAYTFLDGRLKVTSGGRLNKTRPTGEDNNSTSKLTNFVGDWSLEYSITSDGKLRIKVFQDTNYQLTNLNNHQALRTGISVKYIHSFNTFIELLRIKREEAITASNSDS